MYPMKSIQIVLLAATVLVCPLIASAQTPTIPAELMKDWQAQKETMLKIADAMPVEKFSYKSTPAQRSYAEQILHVAGANVELLQLLGERRGHRLSDPRNFLLSSSSSPRLASSRRSLQICAT